MSLVLKQFSGFLSELQSDLAAGAALRDILAALRSHMRMESAFIAEVSGDHSVAYLVDTTDRIGLSEGRIDPRDSTVSGLVLSEKGLEAVADVDADTRTNSLPFCREFGIRSFVGVPVRLANGELFGVLCCLDTEPRPDLGPASADLMRVTAELVGRHLTRLRQQSEAGSRFRERLDQTIATGSIRFARQPIVEIATGRTAGMEYLARFPLFSGVPVNMVFEQAHLVAADRDFEGEVLRRLATGLTREAGECRQFVNVSPGFLADARGVEIFGRHRHGLVLEVLEHDLSGMEDDIRAAMAESEGAYSLAVDDFGVGYSNLARVLAVGPEFLKIDRSLISEIDRDPVRRALMSAVVRFARETGVQIIAEGVERSEEAVTLSRIGVRLAQGYHFARPEFCDW